MRALVVLTLVLATGCAQTVLVHAPPGSRLQVEEEPPVVVPADGAVEVDVPVGYLDPSYTLAVEHDAPATEGNLERTALNGWVATPIVSATICGGVPLAGCGFCLANPTLPISLALAGLSPVLLGSFVATLGRTADTPSWATIPAVILCAASSGVCLFAMPFAMRVPEEVELQPVAAPPPERAPPRAPKGAMLW